MKEETRNATLNLPEMRCQLCFCTMIRPNLTSQNPNEASSSFMVENVCDLCPPVNLADHKCKLQLIQLWNLLARALVCV